MNKFFSLKTFFFLIASLPAFAGALTLPKAASVPGGVAQIPLNTTAANQVVAKFQGQPCLVVAHPKQAQRSVVLVGIPLSAKPGTYELQVKLARTWKTIPFEVNDKAYVTEKLNIPNQRKVTPLKQDYTRINDESQRITKLYQTFSRTEPKALTLQAPISGRKSSSFGRRRIMNGVPKQPHSGMDIAAPLGTEIKAPLKGKVIEAKDYFFAGNTVLIDHGHGFITGYAHLNEIKVKIGDTLQAGDILGTVGKTGRVTGPHLHWSVSLNGVRVDPGLFLN